MTFAFTTLPAGVRWACSFTSQKLSIFYRSHPKWMRPTLQSSFLSPYLHNPATNGRTMVPLSSSVRAPQLCLRLPATPPLVVSGFSSHQTHFARVATPAMTISVTKLLAKQIIVARGRMQKYLCKLMVCRHALSP